MSYTKKQLNALRDILSRCREDKRTVYTVPVGDRELYAVSDGACCVILPEKPGDLPAPTQEDDTGKHLYDLCQQELEHGDHTLVENPVTAEDCKAAIRQWKADVKNRVPYTPAEPRIKVENNNAVGWYDARKLMDTMNAIGPRPMMYIGCRKIGNWRPPFPSLLLMEHMGDEKMGLVMPIRVR